MKKCQKFIYRWVWVLYGDETIRKTSCNPISVNVQLRDRWFIDREKCIEDAKRQDYDLIHKERREDVDLVIVSKNIITGFFTEEIISPSKK